MKPLSALAAIALLATPAAAQAPSFGASIDICRLAFAELLSGQAPSGAKALRDAMDEAGRAYVDTICSAYFTGIADLQALQKPQGEATPI